MSPMDAPSKRRPLTARDWLIVTGAGVVIVVLGQVGLGILIGLFGLGGLAWRLAGDR